ncbi:MAG: acyl dehydratase [Betaproteobacteria bacterium]|nr:acyl dehydratase [Betaproteobacteria bacterium]
MIFFEDMIPGESANSPTTVIDRDELIAFAKRWDPMPYHIDEASGQAAFGGITAPGAFMIAVKQRLVHQLPDKHAVIASFGYDELRFHAPLRPGDAVYVKFECVSRRESNSKPDRGIVTVRMSLINQAGVTVMSHLDTVLVRRRTPDGARTD